MPLYLITKAIGDLRPRREGAAEEKGAACERSTNSVWRIEVIFKIGGFCLTCFQRVAYSLPCKSQPRNKCTPAITTAAVAPVAPVASGIGDAIGKAFAGVQSM
jgi:hypothetical protein